MLRKAKVDFREQMKRAIAVMKQSVDEERPDGKASPLVGALLLMPDGVEQLACRGELRSGDHAEFTLLERKNRSKRLDGSTLFATLEPCAPGARKHPKLSCAERIVNARIKTVWVGIEDPDPTVDRKGIKFLQDHGIEVKMFDRDLQEAIIAANGHFISQAIERRSKVKEVAKDMMLSPLEKPAQNVELVDLSKPALTLYRSRARISGDVDSAEFNRLLLQQGLLAAEGKHLVPAGFGVLLFGIAPRLTMPQAGLLGTIHYPDGTEEVKDFDGPMVQIPEQAIDWLKSKLPNSIDRSEARRSEPRAGLLEMVREGVVNALVHRSYGIAGAKCQLVVTPETIIVKSPGMPVLPITVEQLQTFNSPMLSRNPVLHYVFAKMELAEERGLGLKSMKSGATKLGLSLPTYGWEDPYLVLTIYRAMATAKSRFNVQAMGKLSKSERAGLEWLSRRTDVRSPEYATAMGIPSRTALHHLKHFVALGFLERTGAGPSTSYKVVGIAGKAD